MASLGSQVQPSNTAEAAEPHSIRHAFYKTISAILYLLDFASNIYVAYQFYEFDVKHKTLENIQPNYSTYKYWERSPIFFTMVSVMIIGHISFFVVFLVVDLQGDKHPGQLSAFMHMRRALCRYILPVAQFQRAVQGLKCYPFNGDKASSPNSTDEARVEALYSIVSATTDGGPLFLIQYIALTLDSATYSPKSGASYSWKPGNVLVLSLCLSALSATWNVARAIVFLLPLKRTWASRLLALSAGAFTLSALTVRCTSMVLLIDIRWLNPKQENQFQYQFYVILGIYVGLIVAIPFIGYYLLSREGASVANTRLCCSKLYPSLKSTLNALGFTYVSIPFGPLYPFASVAETSTTMQVSTRFHTRLCFYAACRWILEVSFTTALLMKKLNPCTGYHNMIKDQTVTFKMSPMMPCRLYIPAMAIGLPTAVMSQILFQVLVGTQAIGTTSQNDIESESKLTATCEIGSGIGSAALCGIGFFGI